MGCCEDIFSDVYACFAYKMTLVRRPELIYTLLASRTSVPVGQGNQYTTRLFHDKPAVDVPLPGCCETPPPCPTKWTDTTFTTQEYGCWEPICIIKEIHKRNPDLNERAILSGRQMKDTEDSLSLKILNSAIAVINGTHGENGDRPAEPTEADIKEIEDLLDENNAIYVFDKIEARNLIGTCPQSEAYIGVGQRKIASSFEAIKGFTEKKCYPSQNCLLRSEKGIVSHTRFFFSNRGIVEEKASAKGRNVYTVFIGGLAAMSIADLQGYPPVFKYLPPNDRMERCANTYWKMNWGGVLNPEQHVYKYRVTERIA